MDNLADARLVREALASAPGFSFEVEHARNLDTVWRPSWTRPSRRCFSTSVSPSQTAWTPCAEFTAFSVELPIVVFTGLDDEEMGCARFRAAPRDTW